MIHLVTGLPGAGKTTIAKILEQKLNGVRINIDEVYRLLYEQPPTGDFPPDRLITIYKSLESLAHYLPKSSPDTHFIFEGSFRTHQQRNDLKKAANNHPFRILFIESDEITIRKRIENRLRNHQALDTFEDYLKVKAQYETPSLNKYTFIIRNNFGVLKQLEHEVKKYIQWVMKHNQKL